MAITIRLRRDTAANWTSINPVLALGEPGIETDTAKTKYGDGSTEWNDLPYASGTGGSTVYAGTATLASGVATISSDWVTTDSIIVVTAQAAPSTPGTALYVDPANIVVATSFDISSDDGTDSRDVFWMATEPITPAPTGFAMEADTPASDSYVIKDLGSDQSDLWLKYECGFLAAAFDFWQGGGGSGWFGGFLDVSDAEMSGTYFNNAGEWSEYLGGNSATPTPTGSTWFIVEQHFTSGTTNVDLYIDGNFIFSATAGANPARKIVVGQYFASPDAASIAYIKNVKVGTTQGGTDLFQDDFSSEDLSNWTSTVGTCTVISSPF